jgi:hypothetical protein
MKRVLFTAALAAQPVIISLLAGNDLTRTGVDASMTYMVTLIVGLFAYSVAPEFI